MVDPTGIEPVASTLSARGEWRSIYPPASGGDEGTRTPCLHIANVALYRLSYIPRRGGRANELRAQELASSKTAEEISERKKQNIQYAENIQSGENYKNNADYLIQEITAAAAEMLFRPINRAEKLGNGKSLPDQDYADTQSNYTYKITHKLADPGGYGRNRTFDPVIISDVLYH